MKLVMTLMVRDEVDIIDAMLRHHFDQGIDHIIATDNASIDGTSEILEAYANEGLLTLHRDPRHEKQQADVVTKMAREAATEHQATWVLNADADEFWVAEDREMTLREALEDIPVSFKAFEVPVIDMTGAPAYVGSGISRLIYRDRRPIERMNALGHHAHASNNVVFVADPKVEVAQGNHAVSIKSQGRPAPGRGIEVLHLPWRSWRQLSRKVQNAGLAYERGGLTPSPNHHGMRDYQRLKQGQLFGFYVARHPNAKELEESAGSLIEDRRLADALTDAIDDVRVPDESRDMLEAFVVRQVALESELSDLLSVNSDLRQVNAALDLQALESKTHVLDLESMQQKLVDELTAYRSSKVFRIAQRVGKLIPSRNRPG